MHSSVKLAVPILIAAAAGAAVTFSPHLRSSSQITGTLDTTSVTPVSATRSSVNPSGDAAVANSVWTSWVPLTADGQ